MPRVDFYILADANSFLFACRLLEKIYQQQQTVLVNVETQEQAQHLNDLLWTFSDISFIPHDIFSVSNPSIAPVQITHNLAAKTNNEILFNLASEIPNCYAEYVRIIEIVPLEQTLKDKSRERFKFYREQKCEMFTHDLTKK